VSAAVCYRYRMLSTRFARLAGLTLIAFACAVFAPAVAHASVSIAVSWDGLLRESSSACIVTAFEARGAWENGRIYTYTHIRIDRAVAGNLATGSDAWVRTMGGVVGDIGQRVEGEATLAQGQSSLLFLRPGLSTAFPQSFEVTARGQGQFPLETSDPKLPARISAGHALGLLVHPHVLQTDASPRLAAEVLLGRTVDEAVREVTALWSQTHAP
jgi:hypothetical protein